jgi:lysophospholipase L1-like esterase
MANLAKKNSIRPVLCSVLPVNELTWRPEIKPTALVIELNQKIRKYCKESNILYIDYFSSMVGEKKELRPELTYDGVHPNKEGYIIMEGLLEAVLKKF